MRLLVCLATSAALHAILFGYHSDDSAIPEAPSLAISLQQRSVNLQIVTQVRTKEIAPLPPEEQKPKPTPPPKPRPEKPKKAVKQKAKPLPTPKVKKEESEPLPKPLQQAYVSDAERKPRKIEPAEYLSNPPPKYPKQARRRGQEGTVTLLVDINAKGVVKSLRILESSGFSTLDRAAKEAVAKWRFTPATQGTKQLSSRVIVPILFQLS